MDVPPPPDLRVIQPLLTEWKADTPLVRIYNHTYQPTTFNPGRSGGVRGRFHFFADPAGDVVPVLYGSDQEEGALAETVFHDVPVSGRDRIVLASRLEMLSMATLAPRRDLRLVELSGYGLWRFRIRPEQLTSTEAALYPKTVLWAQALHHTFPEISGLVWMSRQFNSARALVLFRDRVSAADLRAVEPPLPLRFGPGRSRVDEAANQADITIL